MLRTAFTFLSEMSIPCALTTCPRYSTLFCKNLHLLLLILKFCSCSFCRTASKLLKCSCVYLPVTKKFYQYIFSYRFTLVIDHKPLLTIFGPKLGIRIMAASRLQRWAIILSTYTYDIQYKPTKEHGNADTLSQCPDSNDNWFEKE